MLEMQASNLAYQDSIDNLFYLNAWKERVRLKNFKGKLKARTEAAFVLVFFLTARYNSFFFFFFFSFFIFWVDLFFIRSKK